MKKPKQLFDTYEGPRGPWTDLSWAWRQWWPIPPGDTDPTLGLPIHLLTLQRLATRKQETRKEQEGADWGPIRTEEFASWRPKEVKDVYGRGSQGGGEGPTLQQERNCQECSYTFSSLLLTHK